MTDTDQQLCEWRSRALALEACVARAIVGQSAAIRNIAVSMFARGHVLLEGDVGVGKTTLLRAFARATGGAYARVEGTIDLMPGDLIIAPVEICANNRELRRILVVLQDDIDGFRATEPRQCKAPVAGNGVTLVKSGNAAMVRLGGSLRARR